MSMTLVALYLSVLLLLLLGLLELTTHRRNLNRIRLRIHVNGTRGKSSVTRLIAAGLREGGIRTCAKTTGTLPRMILDDGREFPVFRPSRANIIEQRRIVSTAAAYRAEALVVECMAIQPALQSLSELKLIRSTHGVITNARADHLDAMGPTEQDIAKALAGTTPVNGHLFTTDDRFRDEFAAACSDRHSVHHPVTSHDAAYVSDDDLRRFSYTEHRDNVALALSVCEACGVDRQVALRGMWRAKPDPGALTECRVDFFGRRIYFVNGFAANDPESTGYIWKLMLEKRQRVDRRVAIFNCRADRPERSEQLGKASATWPRADRYLLIGGGTYLFAKAATDAGLPINDFVFAEDLPVSEIFETIIGLCSQSTLVMGMGNIGGPGLELVDYFHNRSALDRD